MAGLVLRIGVVATFAGCGVLESALQENAKATITTFDPPGSTSTLPMSINDAGSITGLYYGGSNGTGFVRAADGTFTTFGVPNSWTYPRAINRRGAVTGERFSPFTFRDAIPKSKT